MTSSPFSCCSARGELRAVPWEWYYFTWHWSALPVSQRAIDIFCFFEGGSFKDPPLLLRSATNSSLNSVIHIYTRRLCLLAFVASLLCWGHLAPPGFLDGIQLKITHSWLPSRRNSCDPSQHVCLLTSNSEAAAHSSCSAL